MVTKDPMFFGRHSGESRIHFGFFLSFEQIEMDSGFHRR